MTKENDEGRKSARAKTAKKRDEDVLEADGDDKSEGVKKAPGTTAKRRGGDGKATEAKKEAKADKKKEAEESTDNGDEAKADAADDAGDAKEKESPEKLDPLEAGQAWLTTLFEKMGLELEVETESDGDNFVFNISGSDADNLVGRSHQSPRVLKSVQTLLSEHLGKAARGNVIVDLGGFKQKRHSRLTAIAEQLRQAVGRTGEPIKIAGLNSYERRVVHQHLADQKDVDTDSVDQGIFRKLRITPD